MWSDVTHALSASNVAWVVIVTVRVCPSDLCMVYAHVTLSLRWPFGPPRGEAPTRRTLLYGDGWRFGDNQPSGSLCSRYFILCGSRLIGFSQRVSLSARCVSSWLVNVE